MHDAFFAFGMLIINEPSTQIYHLGCHFIQYYISNRLSVVTCMSMHQSIRKIWESILGACNFQLQGIMLNIEANVLHHFQQVYFTLLPITSPFLQRQSHICTLKYVEVVPCFAKRKIDHKRKRFLIHKQCLHWLISFNISLLIQSVVKRN